MKKNIYKKYLKLFVLNSVLISTEMYASTILDNQLLKFGSEGTNAINTKGNLDFPQYKSSDGNYYQLTFSNSALSSQISIGGTGTNEWNLDGNHSTNTVLSNHVLDYSGFNIKSTDGNHSKGYGTIVSTGTITVNEKNIEIKHTYVLGASDAFMQVTTQIKNLSAEEATNVRLWIGTGDDYVGNTDSPNKKRGQIIDGIFVATTESNVSSPALKVSAASEGILFYSTSERANTIISDSLGFSNITDTDPLTSDNNLTGDGSYGFFIRLNDLSFNETDKVSWFYAAGALNKLSEITTNIQNASLANKSINEDTNATFSTIDFVDSNNSQTLEKVQFTSLPNHGILQLNNIPITINQEITSATYHTLTYTPNLNYNGNDSFELLGTIGLISKPQTFIIRVRSTPDTPTIETIFSNVTIADTNGTETVDVSISDLDSSELTLTVESNDTSIITVTPSWNTTLDNNNWIQEFNLTRVSNTTATALVTVTVKNNEFNSTKTFFTIDTPAPTSTTTNTGSINPVSREIVFNNGEINTIVNIDETLEVIRTDTEETQGIILEIGDIEVNVQIQNDGRMNGGIEVVNEAGERVQSTIKIDQIQSTTNINSDGSINTTIATENNNLSITVEVDGSVKYTREVGEGQTQATSAILGSTIEVTEEGIVVITSKIEKHGIRYVATLKTDTEGNTTTTFSQIDISTNQEIKISTLDKDSTYSVGSSSSILKIEDLIYIETATSLDGTLTL